jgi:hypothetical protein
MAFKSTSNDVFRAVRELEGLFTVRMLAEKCPDTKLTSVGPSCSQLTDAGALECLGTLPFLMLCKDGKYRTRPRSVYRLIDRYRAMSVEKAVEALGAAERRIWGPRWEIRRNRDRYMATLGAKLV